MSAAAPAGADVARIWNRAVKVAARAHNLAPEAVANPQGWPPRRARQVAQYLAIVGAGCGYRCIARVAGVHHKSISEAIAKLEDRRDDPRFDAWLGKLEERVA